MTFVFKSDTDLAFRMTYLRHENLGSEYTEDTKFMWAISTPAGASWVRGSPSQYWYVPYVRTTVLVNH